MLSNSGTVAEGQCGRCDGLAGVDTLGVMEFDTNTDSQAMSCPTELEVTHLVLLMVDMLYLLVKMVGKSFAF